MQTAVLDPGHGGNGALTSFGATGNGLVEKHLNLTVALFTKDYLEKNYECRVVMTRTTDTDVSFARRAEIARNAKADILHSYHFNGFHVAIANGFETFIHNTLATELTKRYQQIIHNRIYFDYLQKFGITDRGLKQANFAILRMPPTRCVLTEYLFLTNPAEAALLKRAGTLEQLGHHTAIGIAKALSLKPKVEQPSIWYRVIAGSYRDRSNADTAVNTLKSYGFDAFVDIMEER